MWIVLCGRLLWLLAIFSSGRPLSRRWLTLTAAPIAILFSPLRQRVQEVIDRRFFRSKYDAQQMLNQFVETARGETELHKLGQELLSVVEETMQPEHAWLWLRGENGNEGMVTWPDSETHGAPHRAAGTN